MLLVCDFMHINWHILPKNKWTTLPDILKNANLVRLGLELGLGVY
jgi:hypothetical protein